jgi:hypothetical protein
VNVCCIYGSLDGHGGSLSCFVENTECEIQFVDVIINQLYCESICADQIPTLKILAIAFIGSFGVSFLREPNDTRPFTWVNCQIDLAFFFLNLLKNEDLVLGCVSVGKIIETGAESNRLETPPTVHKNSIRILYDVGDLFNF